MNYWVHFGLVIWSKVATWLVSLTHEDIVLCSWVKHFTPMVPLPTNAYKWVVHIYFNAGDNPLGLTLREYGNW